MLHQNIYLSGFMGVGKSVSGKLLATKLSLPFVDTDTWIEHHTGLSIPKIFIKMGEDAFRHLEQKALLALSQTAPQIVSLGGGLVCNASNRTVIRQGIWINLTAHPAIIFQRVKAQGGRPMLGKKIKRETLEDLLKKRQPFYALAPHHIDTTFLSPHAVVEKILKII